VTSINREALRQFARGCLDFGLLVRVARVAVLGQAVQGFGDQLANLFELGDPKTARGRGGRSEADARGDHGARGIERHAIFVAGDAGALERGFRRLAGELLWPQIHQHEMIVGPPVVIV